MSKERTDRDMRGMAGGVGSPPTEMLQQARKATRDQLADIGKEERGYM